MALLFCAAKLSSQPVAQRVLSAEDTAIIQHDEFRLEGQFSISEPCVGSRADIFKSRHVIMSGVLMEWSLTILCIFFFHIYLTVLSPELNNEL